MPGLIDGRVDSVRDVPKDFVMAANSSRLEHSPDLCLPDARVVGDVDPDVDLSGHEVAGRVLHSRSVSSLQPADDHVLLLRVAELGGRQRAPAPAGDGAVLVGVHADRALAETGVVLAAFALAVARVGIAVA